MIKNGVPLVQVGTFVEAFNYMSAFVPYEPADLRNAIANSVFSLNTFRFNGDDYDFVTYEAGRREHLETNAGKKWAKKVNVEKANELEEWMKTHARACYKCRIETLPVLVEEARAYCGKCAEEIKHTDRYGRSIDSWEARYVE